MEYGTYAEWASAVGSILGLGATAFALFKRHADQRALEFDRARRERREDVRVFWTQMRAAWRAFRADHPGYAESLANFAREVGAPPRPRGPQVQYGWRQRVQRLSPHQEMMWTFASAVYPPAGPGAGPTEGAGSVLDRAVFDEVRSRLSWFWNTETLGVPSSHLRNYFRHEYDALVLLCWLDLAYVQSSRAVVQMDTRLIQTTNALIPPAA